MKAIIIEDERRAAERLQRLITEQDSSVQILATLESVQDAKAYLSGSPALDVIFSDIQLADGLSFEIYEEVSLGCPVIFTTAYDQYAIRAFKNNGIDYLLKPIDPAELSTAMAKLEVRPSAPDLQDLMALAAQLSQGKVEYRSRFMVKVGQRLKSIPVEEVYAIYSENKGTYLLTQDGRNHLVDYSLEQVQEMLDPKRYYRVNRKYIVALDGVEEMLLWSNSRLKVKLKGSKADDIIVARERTKEFKSWMEG